MAHILAACAVTVLWLATLGFFPEAWKDHQGYNELAALILASLLHWVICFPLFFASLFGLIRFWLPLLVGVAPLAHWTGSSIDAPGCWPFFLVPSMAILFVGLMEMGVTWQTDSP